MFKYFYDLGGETSTPEPSEETDASDVASNNNDTSLYSQQLNFSTAGDLSRSNSESQLHDLSMELANRGPKQSETELRSVIHSLLGGGRGGADSECSELINL